MFLALLCARIAGVLYERESLVFGPQLVNSSSDSAL